MNPIAMPKIQPAATFHCRRAPTGRQAPGQEALVSLSACQLVQGCKSKLSPRVFNTQLTQLMQVKFCNINPRSGEILVFTKELPETLTQFCPSTDQQMCQVDRKTSPFLWNLSVMTLCILYNHVYTSPIYIVYICTSVLYMSSCLYLQVT